MIIKKYLTKSEMVEAVNKYNTHNRRTAKLAETMVVKDSSLKNEEYRFHVYAKEGDMYRLINHKPFNRKLTTDCGNKMAESDLIGFGDYEELV